jgi:flagellar biosynthesis protein FlhG
MSSAPRVIEPAQAQFIEKSFGEFLGHGSHGSRNRKELVAWIHQRLFLDRESVSAVRAELNRSARKTRVIAVTSGKGGVGKTTFSVNLAVAFAQLGRRVLLFDADFGMANVHIFAGVNPRATLLDVIDRRASFENLITPGPEGIDVICGASGIGRMADLSAPVIDALGREMLRVAADYDVLLIDTGAGISPSVTHFFGLAQETIVLATPNLASTLDAYGVIKLAHEHRINTQVHVLINLVEDENQAARVLDRLAGCANRFLKSSLSTLGFLERDPAFEQANQSRRPLLTAGPGNPNAQRIITIAARLLGEPDPATAASGGHVAA